MPFPCSNNIQVADPLSLRTRSKTFSTLVSTYFQPVLFCLTTKINYLIQSTKSTTRSFRRIFNPFCLSYNKKKLCLLNHSIPTILLTLRCISKNTKRIFKFSLSLSLSKRKRYDLQKKSLLSKVKGS